MQIENKAANFDIRSPLANITVCLCILYSQNGNTALDRAVANNHTDVVELISALTIE